MAWENPLEGSQSFDNYTASKISDQKTDEIKTLKNRVGLLEKLVLAADDILKAYESEGVNNEVWVAIQYYKSVREADGK